MSEHNTILTCALPLQAPACITLNEGPLKVFRLLHELGDSVAFQFELLPMLELEVLEYTCGPIPSLYIDLSSYAVEGMQLRGRRL